MWASGVAELTLVAPDRKRVPMDHGRAGRDLLSSSRLAGRSTRGEAGPGRASADEGESPATTSHVLKGARGGGWFGGTGVRAGLPLIAVLVVQTLLSVRLLGADTAFADEAAYLWAGHLEWAHWLHGVSAPPFSAYFSGSPVMYPPLGALADSVGGLAGARALSLVFMLGATVLLWDVTSRMFGRQAGFFAAALFAVAGPTLHLGAFATYDAMSLFLLALAAWLVAGASDQHEATGRMAGAGAVLALANATAYSSVLFDPVIVALALVIALPSGGRFAARRCGALVTVLVALLIVGVLLGGSSYWQGITQTTLGRAAGAASPLRVLEDAWSWTGAIIVLAVCGVIASWISHRRAAQTWLLAVLTAAALLGPLEQAHLHTLDALNKHVGLGAWFAAIAAGYAVDKFINGAPAGQARTLTCAACVIALAFPASLGITQSREFATSWANSATFIAILRPLAAHGTGHLLVEDPSIAEYYLPSGSHWQRWSSTRNIVLPGGSNTGGPTHGGVVGAGDPAAFDRYISQGYFSLIALNFGDTTALDHRIATEVHQSPLYRTLQVVPYTIGTTVGTYIIYKYEPGKHQQKPQK
jgi:Dolichyl-phosphate-mannose-protein mannosyltransferase